MTEEDHPEWMHDPDGFLFCSPAHKDFEKEKVLQKYPNIVDSSAAFAI